MSRERKAKNWIAILVIIIPLAERIFEHFKPGTLGEVWVSDITYFKTNRAGSI